MESTDPYRASTARTLCAECSEPTSSACERCARPLCVEHAPPSGERCVSCERAFTEQITREEPAQRRRLATIGTLIVSAYVVLVFAAGFSLGELAVWILVIAAAVATPLLWRRSVIAIDRERRRAFLRERPPDR